MEEFDRDTGVFALTYETGRVGRSTGFSQGQTGILTGRYWIRRFRPSEY